MAHLEHVYEAFGELLYAVTMVDGEIQDSELDKLKAILAPHAWSDQIQWSFEFFLCCRHLCGLNDIICCCCCRLQRVQQCSWCDAWTSFLCLWFIKCFITIQTIVFKDPCLDFLEHENPFHHELQE